MSLFSALFGEHTPKTDPYYKTDIGYLRTSEYLENGEFINYYNKLTVTNVKNLHLVFNQLTNLNLIDTGCEHCCRGGTFIDKDYVWKIRDTVMELKDYFTSEEHESIHAFAKITSAGRFEGLNAAKWLRLTMFFLNHSIKRMNKIPAKYHLFFRYLENRYSVHDMDKLAFALNKCEANIKNIDKTLKASNQADILKAEKTVIGDIYARKDNDIFNTAERMLRDILRYNVVFNPNESLADIYRALLEYSRGYYYK